MGCRDTVRQAAPAGNTSFTGAAEYGRVVRFPHVPRRQQRRHPASGDPGGPGSGIRHLARYVLTSRTLAAGQRRGHRRAGSGRVEKSLGVPRRLDCARRAGLAAVRLDRPAGDSPPYRGTALPAWRASRLASHRGDRVRARIVAPATTKDVGQTARESVYVTAARGRRVELDVALSAPGLVVLNQLYDPHWTVAIQSDTDDPRTAPVVRTNRIMQGVFLPAGRHHLVFCYVPRDLYAAGAVSLASWLALAAGLGWFRCTRRQHTRFRRP